MVREGVRGGGEGRGKEMVHGHRAGLSINSHKKERNGLIG